VYFFLLLEVILRGSVGLFRFVEQAAEGACVLMGKHDYHEAKATEKCVTRSLIFPIVTLLICLACPALLAAQSPEASPQEWAELDPEYTLYIDVPMGRIVIALSKDFAPNHQTYPLVDAPWAPAGDYTIRLAVGGRQFEQPLTLRLDPRVKTSAAELEHVTTLSREMYDGAVAAHAAYEEARAMVERLAGADLKAEVEALAPAPGPTGGRRFRGAAPSGPPTLNGVSTSLMSAAMSMQAAEVGPTERQVAACDAARTQLQEVMQRWEALRERVRR
jgi:hypothetical protein